MHIIPSLFLCFIVSLSFLASPIQSSSSGFSINLIHRDSPLSPYYNSSVSYYENIRNSIRRSKTRSSHIFTPNLASHPPTIQSPLIARFGDYLMKISVGTPPLDFLAVADTGSELTWINCKPCTECYQQTAPLFDPKKSSTYEIHPCQSKVCQDPHFSCNNGFCHYEVVYGDGSYSTGDVSLESFTFETTSGEPIVLREISFGCGHTAGGNFDNSTDGIVGLGNSNLSIVNQLGNTINGKFSYCVVPFKLNVTSKISFGSDAIVSGSGVQTTPFFTKDQALFYYLYLEGVSIGEENIKFNRQSSYMNNVNDKDGNIIIDSGTTLTFLPNEFYQLVEDEFKRHISSTPVQGEEELTLCYKNEEGFVEQVPTITFNFPGAKLELGVSNTMLELEDGKLCFAIAPGDTAIFGNALQTSYLIGYDLEGKTLSFKKTDCTKL